MGIIYKKTRKSQVFFSFVYFFFSFIFVYTDHERSECERVLTSVASISTQACLPPRMRGKVYEKVKISVTHENAFPKDSLKRNSFDKISKIWYCKAKCL